MPVVGDRLDFQHRHRGRANQRIHALAQPVRGQRLGDVDMRRHPQRVDPGIGPPGAMHRDGLAGHLADRLFERLLDRFAQCLPLPADERPAVIFERQLPAGHERIVPAGIAKPRSISSGLIARVPAAGR